VESFENDDPNQDVVPDSLEEGHRKREVDDTDDEDAYDERNVVVYAEDDESVKRRERRSEREGDRLRKVGLCRNYLMVDEHTKKPFGPGVGEWRKELMLLSRNLDPAIGNINKQPEGTVAKIAEWIQ